MREYEIYERLVIVTTSMRIHSFIGFVCLASLIFENVMLFLGYIFFDLTYIVINIFLTLGFFENKNLFEILMEAVKYCSLGEITDALYLVGGKYSRNL